MRWKGEYLVLDLSDFVGKDLHHDAPSSDFHVVPHVTTVIRVPKGDFRFPLKSSLQRKRA